jgi:hypothetical protein
MSKDVRLREGLTRDRQSAALTSIILTYFSGEASRGFLRLTDSWRATLTSWTPSFLAMSRISLSPCSFRGLCSVALRQSPHHPVSTCFMDIGSPSATSPVWEDFEAVGGSGIDIWAEDGRLVFAEIMLGRVLPLHRRLASLGAEY